MNIFLSFRTKWQHKQLDYRILARNRLHLSQPDTQSIFSSRRIGFGYAMQTPLLERVSLFLSERYRLRELPSYLPELILFGMIVALATWPMFYLASAMTIIK